jgi:hypothetical protein
MHSIRLPLEYRKVHDPRFRTGLLITLNGKVSLFYCRAEMSVGTPLRVRVMFADGNELSSFEALAKIVWKHLHFEQDLPEYEYGAEFTHISEEDKQKLNRLLTTCSLEQKLENYKESSNRDNHAHPIAPQETWGFQFLGDKGLG